MKAHTVIAAIGALLGIVVGLGIVALLNWPRTFTTIEPLSNHEITGVGPDGEVYTFRVISVWNSEGWVKDCGPENEKLKCVGRYDPDEVKRRTLQEEGNFRTTSAD